METLLRAFGRAYSYRQRFGWRHFFIRLIHVWVWLPRLTSGPLRPQEDGTSFDKQAQIGARPFGVNIISYITDRSSLGEAARLAAAAFETAGVPVAMID